MKETTTGALTEDAGTAASESDGLDAILMADDYVEDVAPESATPSTAAEGQPAENPAQDTASETAEQPEDTTAEATDSEPDDPNEAPKLKEIRGKLSRSEYRTLAEHFESRTAEQLRAANEAAEATRQANAAREAQIAEIRQRQGSFIGETAVQIPDGQGGFKPGPTYDELTQLARTQRGRDALYEKYGLDEPSSEYLMGELEQRRAMLDGAVGHFREDAWMEMGKMLAASVASSGLDLQAVWKNVQNAGDVVTSVVNTMQAKHAAEIKRITDDYEGRLKAVKANDVARVAQTTSKRLPTPETGGRGDASGARIYTTSELDQMSTSEFRALEADIDLAYAQGRIVPG